MIEAPLQLHLSGLQEPEYEPTATLSERFDAFHQLNPHVYDALRDLALDLVDRGHTRIGIKMLFEVLRWSAMRTSGEEWKLNNNFHSRYARLLADTCWQLADVFEMRRLHTL